MMAVSHCHDEDMSLPVAAVPVDSSDVARTTRGGSHSQETQENSEMCKIECEPTEPLPAKQEGAVAMAVAEPTAHGGLKRTTSQLLRIVDGDLIKKPEVMNL